VRGVDCKDYSIKTRIVTSTKISTILFSSIAKIILLKQGL